MPVRLGRISISGYRSIRRFDDCKPGNLTVITGAPGSGKSNFINFFLMLNFMMNGNLQSFINYNGGPTRLLHQGIPPSESICGSLTVSTEKGLNDYEFTLTQKNPKVLLVSGERQRFRGHETTGDGKWYDLKSNSRETRLGLSGVPTQKALKGLLLKFVVHHFTDIVGSIRVLDKEQRQETRYLRTDGANLGTYLQKIAMTQLEQFQRIVSAVSSIVPCFEKFVFDADSKSHALKWCEKGVSGTLDMFQASPYVLRFMALVTLLNVKCEEQSSPIIIDDIENGMDSRALELLAILIKEAADNGRQIFVTTKSPAFIRYFHADQILLAERGNDGSGYRYCQE